MIRSDSQRLKTIFFDFGKVIRETSWRRVARRLHPCLPGLDKTALLRVVFPEFLDYEAGILTSRAFWSHVATGLDLRPPEKYRGVLSSAYLDVLAGYNMKMLSFIRALAGEGKWQLAILSNSAPELAQYIENESIVREYFSAYFFSCHAGVRKPDFRIYLSAARSLGREPRECLFIDDQMPNVEAASSLGFLTIHYTGFEDFLHRFETIFSASSQSSTSYPWVWPRCSKRP